MAHLSASETRSLSFHWYQGVAGLRQLENDWLALTPQDGLFARYEWNLAATTHLLGDGEKIWFCRIGDHLERPLAIIPALAGKTHVKPFGQIPALALGWSHQLATFDFPMAHRADALEVGKAMLSAFKKLPFKWSVIAWPRVMADSNAAKVALALGDRWADIRDAAPCSTFYTGSAPDPARGLEIFTVKSSKLRSKLAYTMRRLSAEGQIQMRMAREQGDVAGYFEEFLRLESSGWKGAHGSGTAISLVPSAKAFYSALLAQSNPNFETDIALMFCGEKAVAGQFLIRVAGWEHQYKIAYDEAYAKFSPGQILHQLVIEQAKTIDGIDRVSLVTGQSWHREWAPISEPTREIHIFKFIWQPMVVRIGRWAFARVRQASSRFSAMRNKKVSTHQHEQSSPNGEQAA